MYCTPKKNKIRTHSVYSRRCASILDVLWDGVTIGSHRLLTCVVSFVFRRSKRVVTTNVTTGTGSTNTQQNACSECVQERETQPIHAHYSKYYPRPSNAEGGLPPLRRVSVNALELAFNFFKLFS